MTAKCIWNHPCKTSANFSRFLTSTPLPSANFLRLSVGKFGLFLTPPPKKCRRLKWMVPTMLQQNMHCVEFSKEYWAFKLKENFDYESKKSYSFSYRLPKLSTEQTKNRHKFTFE